LPLKRLGRTDSPVFLHHPLIRKPGGAKLSKSSGDTGIHELRRQGVGPGTVLDQAAYLTGLLSKSRDLQPADLAGLIAAG
jgi:glutamyl/glutaminyl-tRNA synthetase